VSEAGLHFLLFTPAAVAGAFALRAEFGTFAARRSASAAAPAPTEVPARTEPDTNEERRRHHNAYLVLACVLAILAVVADHVMHGRGL
jgi:hypothetical protein